MDPMCIQNSWAIYSSTTVYSTTEVAGFFFRVHTLSEGARPTQALIIVSRVRKRDMARLFDSGEGSVIDSVLLDSMPTSRSSAVLR